MNADNSNLLDDGGSIGSNIVCPPTTDQVDNELDMTNVSCANVSCCNPKSVSHRLIALILMCLLGFGKLQSILSHQIHFFQLLCPFIHSSDRFVFLLR